MREYVIKVTRNSKSAYLRLVPTKAPVFTPMRSDAMVFTDFGRCKNLRDHCLEYVDKADIEVIN